MITAAHLYIAKQVPGIYHVVSMLLLPIKYSPHNFIPRRTSGDVSTVCMVDNNNIPAK
jgi:hypothetical protein